jgi:hypothetical protein
MADVTAAIVNAFDALDILLGSSQSTGKFTLTFNPAIGDKQASFRNATQLFPAASVQLAKDLGWIKPETVTVDGTTWSFELKEGVRAYKNRSGIWGFTDKTEQGIASFA